MYRNYANIKFTDRTDKYSYATFSFLFASATSLHNNTITLSLGHSSYQALRCTGLNSWHVDLTRNGGRAVVLAGVHGFPSYQTTVHIFSIELNIGVIPRPHYVRSFGSKILLVPFPRLMGSVSCRTSHMSSTNLAFGVLPALCPVCCTQCGNYHAGTLEVDLSEPTGPFLSKFVTLLRRHTDVYPDCRVGNDLAGGKWTGSSCRSPAYYASARRATSWCPADKWFPSLYCMNHSNAFAGCG